MRNENIFAVIHFSNFADIAPEKYNPCIWIVSSCTGLGDMSAFFFCGWKNIYLTQNPKISAVKEYKKSIQQKELFDIIVLSDAFSDKNGPNVVKEIRDLGFKGYIISVARGSQPFYAKPYLESGANKVVGEGVSSENCREVMKGESVPSYLVPFLMTC